MKKQKWIVKFINKVDLPWGLSKEQLEEMRKEVEQLTSENARLTEQLKNAVVIPLLTAFRRPLDTPEIKYRVYYKNQLGFLDFEQYRLKQEAEQRLAGLEGKNNEQKYDKN